MQKIPTNMKEIKEINGYYMDLNSKLGEGMEGTVFKASDLNQNEFAIKQMKLRRTIEEFKILSNINHPNIVGCYDFLKTKNNYYLVMELCEGNLQDYLKEKRILEEKEALCILEQILKGCYALDKHGIIHRDLKPANILFKKNIYKIGDFGIAKEVLASQTGCGTPPYYSPQLEKGKKYTSKTDVWSIGKIYYEMLYGKPNYPQLIFDKSIKISDESKQFIKEALQEEEEARLSWEQVFEHPLFKTTNWEIEITNLKQKAEVLSYNLINQIKEKDIDIIKLFTNLVVKDAKGQIEFKTFQEFIKLTKLNLNEEEIHFIFKEVDENKDGRISQLEFLKWLDLVNFCRIQIMKTNPSLNEILKQNNINENTKLDLKEFIDLPVIQKLLKDINGNQLKLIFKSIDLDNSGQISFSEFKNWLDLSNYFREIIKKDLIAAKWNCQKFFELLDSGKNGKINQATFKILITKINPRVEEQNINFIFSLIDENKDEYISEEEFKKWDPVDFLRDILNQILKNVDLNLCEIFQNIDKNNNGALNKEEFQQFILSLDKNLQNLSSIIFESIDRDKNGTIDLEEFIFWLANFRTLKQAFSELLNRMNQENIILDKSKLFKNFSMNQVTLDKYEFRDMCNKSFKKKLTYTECDALFLQFESDDNGQITFKDFVEKIDDAEKIKKKLFDEFKYNETRDYITVEEFREKLK